MYRQSSSSKISASDLMNEIHDSIQKKVEGFIDGLSNNSTLDIIEKLPVVEELRKILNEKEQIISILLEENKKLKEEVKEIRESTSGIQLEIKEIQFDKDKKENNNPCNMQGFESSSSDEECIIESKKVIPEMFNKFKVAEEKTSDDIGDIGDPIYTGSGTEEDPIMFNKDSEDEIYDGPIEGEPEDEEEEAEIDLQSFTHPDVTENPTKLVEKTKLSGRTKF